MRRPADVPEGKWGTQIVFWAPVVKTIENENGEQEEDRFFFMRTYTVFNVDQVEGLEAARPVAAARRRALHEGLVGHRLDPLPLALGVAIVGDAGRRAASGPGEHEEPPMPADETFESAKPGHA